MDLLGATLRAEFEHVELALSAGDYNASNVALSICNAAINGNLPILRVILDDERAMNVLVNDKSANTRIPDILLSTAKAEQREATRMLLENEQIFFHLKDKDLQLAYEVALESGSIESAKLLHPEGDFIQLLRDTMDWSHEPDPFFASDVTIRLAELSGGAVTWSVKEWDGELYFVSDQKVPNPAAVQFYMSECLDVEIPVLNMKDEKVVIPEHAITIYNIDRLENFEAHGSLVPCSAEKIR